jgi:hypothetical protein
VGAAAAALLTSPLLALPAAAAPAAHPEAPAWVIAPGADDCRTELDLTGDGVAVSAALVSNGDDVDLVFAKPDVPERAFLPIRIDHKPFANLVMREADGKTAAMRLSAETLSALRKGGVLQIGWLADAPVEIGLTGSDQALSDLRTCGAQVAQRFHDREAARQAAQDHADAEARAQALADEQMAVVKAQKEAAEAETQRSAAETEHLRAQAEVERQRAQAAAEQQAQADSYPYRRAQTQAYPNDPRDDDDAQPADPYQTYPGYQGYYQPYPPQDPYRRW